MNLQQTLLRWADRLRQLREQAALTHPTDQTLPLQLAELETEMGQARAVILQSSNEVHK